jgi:hypothetical protein
MNVLPSWQAAEDLANDLPNLSKEEQQRMVPRILFIFKKYTTQWHQLLGFVDFEDEVLTHSCLIFQLKKLLISGKLLKLMEENFYTRNLAIIAPYLHKKMGKKSSTDY